MSLLYILKFNISITEENGQHRRRFKDTADDDSSLLTLTPRLMTAPVIMKERKSFCLWFIKKTKNKTNFFIRMSLLYVTNFF